MIELSKRETRLLQILAVVVGILLVYFLIISPIMSLRESINSEYEQNMSKLTTLDKMYEQYQELKQKNSQYSRPAQQHARESPPSSRKTPRAST